MASVKTSVRDKVRHSRERLELIDQLLVKNKHILDRPTFLKKVNSYLPADKQITTYTLDKDIYDLRGLLTELILNENSGVTLDFSKEIGYHYSEPGFSYFKNSVNDEDKNLLMLANSLFNVFKGTPLQEKFSAVVNKVLADSLTGGRVIGLEDVNYVQVDATASIKSNQWIPALLEAIYEKTALEIQYKGFNRPQKKKIICPYVLKQYHNRWYMVAYDYNCERTDKTNVFALDGIEHVVLSNKKYFVDPDFSAEDYFRYSLGIWHWHEKEPIQVMLEFNSYIEMVQTNPLHHSQKTTLSKDGKKLGVTIVVYNSPELEMLILGFSSSVKVLSPKALVKSIADSAQKVMSLYC